MPSLREEIANKQISRCECCTFKCPPAGKPCPDQYKQADSIISLIASPDSPYIKKSEVVKRIDGIENPHKSGITNKYYSEGFNEAMGIAKAQVQHILERVKRPDNPDMFNVQLSRKEFLTLPIETRRRIIRQQVTEMFANIPDEQRIKEMHDMMD